MRERDGASIRSFLEANAADLTGRVLDFGAGRQPYRELVSGEYVPFDGRDFPGSLAAEDTDIIRGSFDAIICTQVLQYVPHPQDTLAALLWSLNPGGVLLMTGPTNWPIVERDDLWRFTPKGIEALLRHVGFRDWHVEARESFQAETDSRWIIGWQARAVA